MKNNILASKRSFAGKYQLSSNVNGKPSFKNSEKDIWYNAKNHYWMIGSLDNLGGNRAAFYTKDEFGGLTDSKNRWHYFQIGWKVARPNEIILQYPSERSKSERGKF